MEQLKHMKETLISCVQSQMSHLDTVDTEELGDVIDMIKDLEKSIYYESIVTAMEKDGSEKHIKWMKDEEELDHNTMRKDHSN